MIAIVRTRGTAISMATADGRPGMRAEDATFNTAVAHQARVYDYWLGGKDNYAADRDAAERAAAAYPGIRRGVRAQRAFLGNVVDHLARAQGIRQFLDIGTGIPTANNTHEVAHRVDPDARIVYVDNDPIVLAHARALLTGTRDGTTSYLDADLRNPEKILTGAAAILDFGKPVAVLLIGVLQLISDDDDPRGIVARLMQAVSPGSWLALFHPANDVLADQVAELLRQLNRNTATPGTLRSKPEILKFFDGLELQPPGLVQVHRWMPGAEAPDMDDEIPGYAGLARKP
jgi:hypothetical protein